MVGKKKKKAHQHPSTQLIYQKLLASAMVGQTSVKHRNTPEANCSFYSHQLKDRMRKKINNTKWCLNIPKYVITKGFLTNYQK